MLRTWLDSADEPHLSEFFADHFARGDRPWWSALRDPAGLVRAMAAIIRLPVLTARLSNPAAAETCAVRAGLRRDKPTVRALVGGTTAVLSISADPDEYLQQPGESKRSLRTKYRKAERLGFTISYPQSRQERLELLELGAAFERNHPQSTYRSAAPDLDHLLPISTWLVACDAEGRPLLLAVVPVDGEWAVLEHFKGLEHSQNAKLARPWLSAHLVQHLSRKGVRHLADVYSPIGLPPGLRIFQRQLGYRLVRVKITRSHRSIAVPRSNATLDVA